MPENKTVDVCLVMPPFSYTVGPSLALGLLKAALLKDGISCRVDYADLHFLKAISFNDYTKIGGLSMGDFIGDYAFCKAAGIEPINGLDSIGSFYRKRSGALGALEMEALLRRVENQAVEQTDVTARRILAYDPKIVGVSSCFQQRNAALAILRRIKELRPDVITLMGGANCFGRAGIATLRTFPFVDYVFFGESDDIFAKTCRIAMGQLDEPLPYGVLKNGGPYPEEAPHRIVTDMDSIPYPDYDDFFELLSTDVGLGAFLLSKDSDEERPGVRLYMEGSRGCWWGEKKPCTFCGLNGRIRKYRKKTPERIFKELLYLTDRYGVNRVDFTDCVMPREWLRDLIPMLKAYPKKFKLFIETRSSLSPSDLRELREAGFCAFQPGIESLSDHTLKLMNKGVTRLMNLSFMKAALENDQYISWNIIYGFPGETEDDYREQIAMMPYIEHYTPPISCALMLYARDNEYTTNPEKYSLKLQPSYLYTYFCPDDKAYIDDVAIYYDADTVLPENLQLLAVEMHDRAVEWAKKSKKNRKRIIYSRLDMAEMGDDRLLVIDTRTCAPIRAQLLLGVERDVYLACREPIRGDKLFSSLQDRYTLQQIRFAVQTLMVKKLLLRDWDYLFALAAMRDMERLKKEDVREFRYMAAHVEYRQKLRKSILDAEAKYGVSDETTKRVITEWAHACNFCFDGEDYSRLATPDDLLVTG